MTKEYWIIGGIIAVALFILELWLRRKRLK